MGIGTIATIGVEGSATETPAIGFIGRLLQNMKTWLRSRTGTTNRSLRHVETLSLGPKKSLFLVECDGQRFLVAAGSDSVSSPVPLTQEFAMKQERTEGNIRG